MDSIERDFLLSAGKVVGDYWFNEKAAQSFITLVTFAQNNNIKEISWPNKNRVWKKIPTQEAVQICIYIIKELQSIYGAE